MRRAGGLALAALVLAGACTSTTPADRAADPTAGPAPVGSLPGPAGAGAYAVQPCPFGDLAQTEIRIECGTLTVPETRGSEGRVVRVAVAWLHARGPQAASDPVLYLEGGPGGSALSGAELWTDPPSPILERHDVILVDPRGTGYSQPRLTCEPELEDEANLDVPEPTLLERCHRRLTDEGIALDRYNTPETAADLRDLRTALGIDRWNLLGVSYGTRLALELMALDPAGTRSAVLDSVYPPGVHGIDEQPANAYAALHALLDDCAHDTRCATEHPDLEARLLDTVRRLDRRPVTVDIDDGTGDGGTEPIDYDGSTLVDDLFYALYDNTLIPDIPAAIELAASGDVQGASDRLAPDTAPGPRPEPDLFDPTADGVIRPDDSDGLFYTIECREEVPSSSRHGVDVASAGVPLALREDLVTSAESEFDSCDAWPVEPAPLSAVTSDVPTLLLGGTYDPITPVRWAREAAKTLSHAEVVELPGLGHATIDGGPCPLRMITTFLDDPSTEVGGSCTTTPRRR